MVMTVIPFYRFWLDKDRTAKAHPYPPSPDKKRAKNFDFF
jgi:hypothetical protein